MDNRELINLLRQRIGHNYIVGIVCLFADVVGDIGRLCSTGPIFQASQVGFDLIHIHLEFYLVWKGYVRLGELREPRVTGTINHHSAVCVGL